MRDREAYNNKSKCLGAMLFEEQAQIFEQLIIFYAPSSVFGSRYLLKKEPWSTSVKSSTVICLSIAVVKVPRNCWERSLNIAVIKYFQNDSLKKNIIAVTEVVFILLFSLTDVSEQKIKMKTRNTIAKSYHSKFSSNQHNGVSFFSYLAHGV